MTTVPMWSTFRAIDSRAGQRAAALPLLSVSQYRGVVRRSEIDSADARAEDLSLYKTCRPGDLVLNRMSAYKGAVGVAKVEGLVSPDYLVMRPTNAALPEFLAFLIKTPWFVGQMTRLVRGIGSVEGSNVRTPRIGASELGSIKIDLPLQDIQEKVVKFLDRATAEIDAFIAEQEVLIQLLAERRAATISRAVTMGTDPAPEMKQTHSAWFPEIPSGWDLLPIWLGASLIQTGPFGSQLHADEYVTGGTPLINPMHIVDGEIRPSPAMSVTDGKAAELKRHALRLGDVVIARRGELGRSAVTTESSVGALCGTGSAIIRLRSDRFDPRYFQLVFSSRQVRDSLLQYSVGSTMDNLNADVVGDLRLPAPPVEDQRSIVRSLERETSEINGAIADAREAITLSRERRAALISAAVTGKIDARVAA